MVSLRETFYRALGYIGDNVRYRDASISFVVSTTNNKLVIQEDIGSYRYNAEKQKESRLFLAVNLETYEFGLYKPRVITKPVFEMLCHILRAEPENVEYEDEWLMDIKPNIKEFPKFIQVPVVKSQQSHRWIKFPTEDHPNGYEIVDGKHIRIDNGLVEVMDNGKIYSWIPDYLTNEFHLKDGTKVKIRRTYSYWYLCRERNIGRAKIWYPITIKGEPDKTAVNFWNDHIDDRLNRSICEHKIEVKDNFSIDKMKYHFYGRQFGDDQIKEYFAIMAEEGNDGECPCPRCQGYDIYYAEKDHAPYYKGWSMDHYKALHAGLEGSLPTEAEMLRDCKCKACKSLRNTKDMKSNYVRKRFRQAFRDKKYTENQMSYLTAGFLADPKILPSEVKEPDKMKLDDFNWRHLKKHFHNFIEDGKNEFIHFDRIPLRKRMAYMHCRLTLVPWKDVKDETEKWLLDVWNTQLKPHCDCKVCTLIKNAESMRLDMFIELMIEPIDKRSYPTGIFSIHFQKGSYYETPIYPIKDYLEHFNKYVIVGEYCTCAECQRHLERMKKSRYLPPAELEAPLCPICNKAVHNKDLIFQNSEIAKAIIKQGKDGLIGVRTALCCGCHAKFMADRMRRGLIPRLKKGDYLYYDSKRITVKEVFPEDIPKEDRVEGEGTLMLGEYTLPEFASLHGKIKLPQTLEEEAMKVARELTEQARAAEAQAS